MYAHTVQLYRVVHTVTLLASDHESEISMVLRVFMRKALYGKDSTDIHIYMHRTFHTSDDFAQQLH